MYLKIVECTSYLKKITFCVEYLNTPVNLAGLNNRRWKILNPLFKEFKTDSFIVLILDVRKPTYFPTF